MSHIPQKFAGLEKKGRKMAKGQDKRKDNKGKKKLTIKEKKERKKKKQQEKR